MARQAVILSIPDALREFVSAASSYRSTLMGNIGKYAAVLVDHVKREKLSGQVLCKYRGVADSIFGQKSGRFKPTKMGGTYRGTLYRNFGAQILNGPAIQFMETLYGRAWEFGFDRKAYTVTANPARGARARLMFFAGGAWRFAKKVSIPAQTFDAKPHIAPSIEETRQKMLDIIFSPFIRWMAKGRGR